MQFSSAVSVDPLILAEANRIVDTTRQEALQFAGNVVGQVRGEAESLLEQERANVQAEASQFVNQIHHQAQRVVDETQSKAATEVQSIVKRASTEVELVKAQANAELSRLRSESQKQMSMLEGRMAELIRINRNVHQKQNEQTALVDSLMQQIHNQNQVISQLQQAPMRSAASGPSNGTDFFQVSTPVGRNPFDPALRVGSEFVQETTHQKDLGVQPSGSARPGGIMPLGSVVQGDDGSSKGNRPKQHHAPKESQKVESAMKEIMSRVAKLEDRVSRSPSAKSPPGKGDPSSSSSSSSLRSGGGGSPGGSNPESNGGSAKSDSSSSRKSEDAYKREKRLMRVKGYDNLKVASIPKNAAECSGFKNLVVSAICRLCKGDEAPLMTWIQRCWTAKDASEFSNVGNYLLLDRTLGHKLLEKRQRFKV